MSLRVHLISFDSVVMRLLVDLGQDELYQVVLHYCLDLLGHLVPLLFYNLVVVEKKIELTCCGS
jgi:hypothetical protein